MNLYKISQAANNGYDTYDALIVAAESEEVARLIHPDDGGWGDRWSTWCGNPEEVVVELVGVAAEGIEPGIVLGSFNAGWDMLGALTRTTLTFVTGCVKLAMTFLICLTLVAAFLIFACVERISDSLPASWKWRTERSHQVSGS
jgi:hypothetical protein